MIKFTNFVRLQNHALTYEEALKHHGTAFIIVNPPLGLYAKQGDVCIVVKDLEDNKCKMLFLSDFNISYPDWLKDRIFFPVDNAELTLGRTF